MNLTPTTLSPRINGVPTTLAATPKTRTPDRHPVADNPRTDNPTTPAPTSQPRPTAQPADNPDKPATDKPTSRAIKRVLVGVSVALAIVVVAPTALSAQDLYAWAADRRGLNLGDNWALLVPVALDLAAVACIGMTIVSAWKRERAGIFGLLVWVFAGVSAYAQYGYGSAERAAGRAQDAYWAMPTLALLGPLLLHAALNRIRRWARKDAGEQHSGAAGFGIRWMPCVAFWETCQAWAVSRREGIDQASDAIAFVRDRKNVKKLPPSEAVLYAFGALGAVDQHRARVWLSDHGVLVDKAAIDSAVARLPKAADRPVAPTADRRGLAPTGQSPRQELPAGRQLALTTSPNQPTGRQATVTRQVDKPQPADRATGRQESTGRTDKQHSPAAVANARQLRQLYPTGLPTADNEGRQKTGWSYDRYTKAAEAYRAGADKTDNPREN